MTTEEEIFRKLLISIGIVIRSVEEAQDMLLVLDATISRDKKPKGLKWHIWRELASKHEKLRSMLK